jgi:hypothetical protein
VSATVSDRRSDTLIRYALDGDADLDGAVNLADFNRLASSFGQSNKIWTDGDSNYDGLVDLADFNAQAGNFGLSAATAMPARRTPAPVSLRNPSMDLGERLAELI